MWIHGERELMVQYMSLYQDKMEICFFIYGSVELEKNRRYRLISQNNWWNGIPHLWVSHAMFYWTWLKTGIF